MIEEAKARKLIKRLVKSCCKKAWEARVLRQYRDGHCRKKYKDFNDWWKKCGYK